jgi:hypothetical protein
VCCAAPRVPHSLAHYGTNQGSSPHFDGQALCEPNFLFVDVDAVGEELHAGGVSAAERFSVGRIDGAGGLEGAHVRPGDTEDEDAAVPGPFDEDEFFEMFPAAFGDGVGGLQATGGWMTFHLSSSPQAIV